MTDKKEKAKTKKGVGHKEVPSKAKRPAKKAAVISSENHAVPNKTVKSRKKAAPVKEAPAPKKVVKERIPPPPEIPPPLTQKPPAPLSKAPILKISPPEDLPPARPVPPAQPPSSPVVKRDLPVPPPVPLDMPKPMEPLARGKVKVNEMVTVKELAEKMSVPLSDLMKKMITLGIMANQNQRLNKDTAIRAADAFNYTLEMVALYGDEALTLQDDASQLLPRPPVVTVMGHVDHGKTSLLDAIRETRVAEKEAGGITQHIGAYQVKTEKGTITFLDTPGHEAFTAMRARGAHATDLVILVVAADDGVMPQTTEALDHARAAGVPIVVAINKCDLPTANPQKIKQELSTLGLAPEDWGGKTVMVEVSARQKTNLGKLLEMILLEAELLELKANPNRPAQGVVVEAKLDSRRGPVATVLIQKGTLRVGDAFVCGLTAGKVRALTDHRGQRVKEAPPSYPVEILGLSGTPQAGDKLVVVSSDREAREIAERRQIISIGETRSKRQHLTLEDFHQAATAGKIKTLPIVLKTDVRGSLEAIQDSLLKLSTEEISLKLIHVGVGGINTSDVILADASDAVILGFNVRPDPSSEELARRDGVEIKTYRIIYELINEVKAGLEGLLDPEEKEVTLGWAEIRQVFRATKIGVIAGCMVTEGKVSRSAKVRLVRNGAIAFEGTLASLRRFKDDIKEVEKGYECGIAIANFQDVKVGDRIEVYILEKKARKL